MGFLGFRSAAFQFPAGKVPKLARDMALIRGDLCRGRRVQVFKEKKGRITGSPSGPREMTCPGERSLYLPQQEERGRSKVWDSSIPRGDGMGPG